MKTIFTILLFMPIFLYGQTNSPTYNALVSPIIAAGDISAETFNGVKVYRAILTQTGTSAPSATVLSNSIGELSWVRDSVGVYRVTSDSLFTVGKVYCLNNIISAVNSTAYEVAPMDVTQIKFRTVSSLATGTLSDDIFLNTFIEIRIYP